MHPTYLFISKKCRSIGAVILNCFIHYYPYVFLLSLHLVTLLVFLILFMSLFFQQQMHVCLKWSLPSITER